MIAHKVHTLNALLIAARSAKETPTAVMMEPALNAVRRRDRLDPLPVQCAQEVYRACKLVEKGDFGPKLAGGLNKAVETFKSEAGYPLTEAPATFEEVEEAVDDAIEAVRAGEATE